MEVMVENVADPGVGGGERVGLWPVLLGLGPSRPVIRVGDVDTDTPDGPDPWGLPPQVGPSDDRETAVTTV